MRKYFQEMVKNKSILTIKVQNMDNNNQNMNNYE